MVEKRSTHRADCSGVISIKMAIRNWTYHIVSNSEKYSNKSQIGKACGFHEIAFIKSSGMSRSDSHSSRCHSIDQLFYILCWYTSHPRSISVLAGILRCTQLFGNSRPVYKLLVPESDE